ncbi:MAG: NUDIX domain-containing protein [Acetatifactor sp.]|nr:NUDIX domain-containing protein [Acetatifactor sp.]
MERILTLDERNYSDEWPIYERTGVRAVIRRGEKVMMQQNKKGLYKLPGGGVQKGEEYEDALRREVEEETGLIVKPDSLISLGEILEMREDIFSNGLKFVQHSYYYICEVEEKEGHIHMTDSEIEAGFHPVWATIDEIVENNKKVVTAWWEERDTRFLIWFKEQKQYWN